ncbi:hypothetical protein COO60DRAFT_1700260 [Scenedesmus sp. NREL 46B-D3]|nr:hypothetical protein COO60DRAFT_1700260 [Scenedesmus sp. NREL 46B-D3]
MADFIVKTMPPKNIIGRGLNSISKGSGSRAGKGAKRGHARQQQQQQQQHSSVVAAAAMTAAAAAAAAAEEERSAGPPTAPGTAVEQLGQRLEQQQRRQVSPKHQQQQQQRQLDVYGFHWRSNPGSQQLVVLGELPGSWLQQQQQEEQQEPVLDLQKQVSGLQQQQQQRKLQQGQPLLCLQDQQFVQQQQQQQQPRRQKFKALTMFYAGAELDWWRIAETAALERAQDAAVADLAALAKTDDAKAAGTGLLDGVGSDEEFYESAAAGAGASAFTLQQAPVRRFYQVGFLEPDSQPWAVLEPAALATRGRLPQLLRHLPQLTRVEAVVDPCHPCLHNPLPRPLLPPGGAARRPPLMLLAAQPLQPGTLLGMYYGEAKTLAEDVAHAQADLTGEYGMRHAYNMDVHWSKGGPECSGEHLVVIGDCSSCRMALLNDAKDWAAEMGPCPQHQGAPAHAAGSSTLLRYIGRSPNIRFGHLLYRASDRHYLPAIAVYTTVYVAPGAELLADYSNGDDAFWSTITANIEQCNYATADRQQLEALHNKLLRMQVLLGVNGLAGQPSMEPTVQAGRILADTMAAATTAGAAFGIQPSSSTAAAAGGGGCGGGDCSSEVVIAAGGEAAGVAGLPAAPLNGDLQQAGVQTSGEGGKMLCQCGKLEPIEAFGEFGPDVSCRARLQKRRAHNTAKSHDSHACSYHRQRLPGGSDQKRHKGPGGKKAPPGQRSSAGPDGPEDGGGGFSEDEMMQEMHGEEDDPAAAAAMAVPVPRNGSSELQYHHVAQRHEAMEAYGSLGAASRAALAAADPAAAAAAAGILMASGNDGAGSAGGQLAAMQEVYAAAAAAAAGAPGAAQGVTRDGHAAADVGAWPALHGGAAAAAAAAAPAMDAAATAAMPAPAGTPTATAALAAVCAALADTHQGGMQQQQQQQAALQGSNGDLRNMPPMDEGFAQVSGLLSGTPAMQQKDVRQQRQRQHQQLKVGVKPDPAALAAIAADVSGARRQGQQQLLGMLKQMLEGYVPQGDAAAAAAAAAARAGGLGSHSGDSAATGAAAAAGAGGGATSSAGGGCDELAGSGATTPGVDSEADEAEDPAAAAAAAALVLGQGLSQQQQQQQYDSAALAALSEAIKAASATDNALPAAAAAAAAAAVFAQSPATAATLMLAQQQQLQQLHASQQQLMKMMAAQQEQQQQLNVARQASPPAGTAAAAAAASGAAPVQQLGSAAGVQRCSNGSGCNGCGRGGISAAAGHGEADRVHAGTPAAADGEVKTELRTMKDTGGGADAAAALRAAAARVAVRQQH